MRHRFSDSVFDALFPTGNDHLSYSKIPEHKSGLSFFALSIEMRTSVRDEVVSDFRRRETS